MDVNDLHCCAGMQSEEVLDAIFEKLKNKALVPTFIAQFWKTWM
jgi:hypothetical protein